MQQQLDARHRSLVSYLKKVEANVDEELTSYLCRFGAVLICGNIERCIEIIILSRLETRAQPRVLNFVKSALTRGQNLDCEAVQQLLNRFDTDWYRRFTEAINASPDIKEGISSCYAIRNSAAHGGSQNIGLRRLQELLDVHKRLIDAVVAATR